MPLLVVGTIALDSVETPTQVRHNLLGGSAVYFSYAASYFTSVRLVGVVGVDMDRVMEAISRGAAGSWSLSNLGPRWLGRNFAPGFRLRHLLKDIRFAAEAIEDLPDRKAATFPGIEMALDLIQRSVDEGNGDFNIHAMERIFLGETKT